MNILYFQERETERVIFRRILSTKNYDCTSIRDVFSPGTLRGT